MTRKKKEIKLKEPVRIRERVLKDGNRALYLDMYLHGERKKDGLKLYLVPEVNANAKLQNENTRKLAEQIKAQRILDIQKVGLVNWDKVKAQKSTLLNMMERYVDDCEEDQDAVRRTRRNTLVRLKQYLDEIEKPDMLLEDVDKEFCKNFVTFLKGCKHHGDKPLSPTTVRLMANRFSACLNMAVREELIPHNPYSLLEKKEKPKHVESDREYLTIEEVKALMDAPCRYEIVKKAFLFSCFTGLRYSDMASLKWSETHTTPDGKTLYIEKKQVKTRQPVTIPLSDEALRWMPERKEGEDKVFHELTITQETVRTSLNEWVEAAGITKHITYHCSRHTAATLLLTLGANLYVVSKIMGHRSIAMTEHYAKIVDAKKIETMNLVNNMFNQPKAKQE